MERKGGPPITSTIDHFLITPNLTDKVVSYESDTIYNNISDHIPLILKLKIDVEYLKTYKRDFKPSVQWEKCNSNHINHYKDTLDTSLLQCNPYHVALRCREFKCTKHTECIHELHNNIITNMSKASRISFPHTTMSKGKKGNSWME